MVLGRASCLKPYLGPPGSLVLQSLMCVQHSCIAKREDVVDVCIEQSVLIGLTVVCPSLIEIHRCLRSMNCEDAIHVNSDAGLSF
jgi:hypothetical protein